MALNCRTVLHCIVQIAQWFTDWLFETILGSFLGTHRRCSPPVSAAQQQIITKSAVELASLIREKKLKSYDVVKAYCERIASVNGEINAMVEGPFLEALEQAAAVDKQLDEGSINEQQLQSKPFFGVPFTTKDSNAVAGKLLTLGLLSRRSSRSKEDAECVRLLREAGAIIIATTNVPEICMWIESRNKLIGNSNNPYDLRRSVGGSSGGEAAFVSACCTGFGLGSDIGGSIRIPSFSCGIFGHKPTAGLVNMRGTPFRTGEEKNSMLVAGPMTRHATDLKPLYKILLGAEKAQKIGLERKIDLKKLRYFYIPCNGMWECNPINAETQRMMSKIRAHFAQLTGSEVTLATLPHLDISHRIWRYWITQEPDDLNSMLGNGVPINPYVELFKKLIGQSDFTMASIYSLVNSILPQDRKEFIESATNELKQALKKLLGNDGVLFYHSSPRSAPFHYYPLLKIFDFCYISILSALHVPSTQVPMGLDSKGMPLGIQVVAAENMDALCLAVAEELERGFGGWVPPFAAGN